MKPTRPTARHLITHERHNRDTWHTPWPVALAPAAASQRNAFLTLMACKH